MARTWQCVLFSACPHWVAATYYHLLNYRSRDELQPHQLVPKNHYMWPWLTPSAAHLLLQKHPVLPGVSSLQQGQRESGQECCGSPGDLTPGMVEDGEGSARYGAHKPYCLCPYPASPVPLGTAELLCCLLQALVP